MRCKTRQDDVVVGDESAGREEDELSRRTLAGNECADDRAHQCLRDVYTRTPRLVMPSDTTSPSDNHEKRAQRQSEHIPLTAVSEPICETSFKVRQGEGEGFRILKIGLLAMKMNIGIAYKISPATPSPKLGMKPKLKMPP